MVVQTRADETIFAELQELIVRHNSQLSSALLPTATAWGEPSRMNLPGVSHCECMCTIVIAKFAQNGYHTSSDAIAKQKLQNSSCTCRLPTPSSYEVLWNFGRF